MKRIALIAILALGGGSAAVAQNLTIRGLVDRTPVLTDAQEIETAANDSGFILLSEILTLFEANFDYS